MSVTAKTPCVGRPRAFDAEIALQQALKVFWRNGYEGTSLTDLTQAMGIKKPSLYATFGNKEQLFLKVLELYEKGPGNFFFSALAQETAYQVAEALLLGAAASYADSDNPQGCVVIQGALSCSEASESIKAELISRRCSHEQSLCDRLQRAHAEGDLPASANPKLLASFIGTVVQGMSVQATNGVNDEELRQVAQMALASFPRTQLSG